MGTIETGFIHLKELFEDFVGASNLYSGDNDLSRVILLQKFEFICEIVYKTLRQSLNHLDIEVENFHPETLCIRACDSEIISDCEVWKNLITDRYYAAHGYDEAVVKDICHNIQNKYIIAIKEMISNLQKLLIKEEAFC